MVEIIKEIYEGDIGFKTIEDRISYSLRKAARAVIISSSNQIAVLYVSKDNYHKLSLKWE